MKKSHMLSTLEEIGSSWEVTRFVLFYAIVTAGLQVFNVAYWWALATISLTTFWYVLKKGNFLKQSIWIVGTIGIILVDFLLKSPLYIYIIHISIMALIRILSHRFQNKSF